VPSAVLLEPPKEVHVFETRPTIVISTDLLEITTATVRDARVNSRHCSTRGRHPIDERDAR